MAAAQQRQGTDIQKTIATQAAAADSMIQLAQALTNMDAKMTQSITHQTTTTSRSIQEAAEATRLQMEQQFKQMQQLIRGRNSDTMEEDKENKRHRSATPLGDVTSGAANNTT